MAKSRRKRDYALEEERRNIRSRAKGFSSRAQERRAIAQGKYPAAKDIARFPEVRQVAEAMTEALKSERARDLECARWAARRSRQHSTRWSNHFGRKRRDAYYQAFVRWQRVPHDERVWDDVYYYLIKYGGDRAEDYQDNPYA